MFLIFIIILRVELGCGSYSQIIRVDRTKKTFNLQNRTKIFISSKKIYSNPIKLVPFVCAFNLLKIRLANLKGKKIQYKQNNSKHNQMILKIYGGRKYIILVYIEDL